MPDSSNPPRRRITLARALIEISFIVFLFYANLLMGEFTASNGRHKTLLFALHDIITPANFVIALLTGVIGYLIFEFLRRKF